MKLKITVDRTKEVGKIKPMNCINNVGDRAGFYDGYLSEARIPYSRLHDSVYIHWHFVDIHSVFPDFNADENNPESYDFAFTDYLIKRLNDAGVKAFYRLGESIENYHTVKTYHIYPPADFEKWARICGKIIEHYNCGWADGFYYGLEYWEIWNEPDNYPDICDNQMWKGDIEQFFRLYEVASNYLKKLYPNIKIGGYGSCGFYEILNKKSAEQANVSSRTEYFVDCFEKFLKFVTSDNHRCPLDFFSWHSYSGVDANVEYSAYVRRKLDEYGLKNTENILNEWNPGTVFRGTLRDSSNIIANMIALQNSPLDMLMYYDCNVSSEYCGLFNPVSKKPFPAFYVFKAFGMLYGLGNQIYTKVQDATGVYALSAYKDGRGVLLVANNSKSEYGFEICGINKTEKVFAITDDNESCMKELAVTESAGYTCSSYETLVIVFGD